MPKKWREMNANERIDRIVRSLRVHFATYLKAKALRNELFRFADSFDTAGLNAVANTLLQQCETTLILSLCRAFDGNSKLSIPKALGILTASNAPPLQLRDAKVWRNPHNESEILCDAFSVSLPALRRAGGGVEGARSESAVIGAIRARICELLELSAPELEHLDRYRDKRVAHDDPIEVEPALVSHSEQAAWVLGHCIDMLECAFTNCPTDDSRVTELQEAAYRVARQFAKTMKKAGLKRGRLPNGAE